MEDRIHTRELADAFDDGRLSRRQFIERALALGMSATAAGAFLAACTRSKKSTKQPTRQKLRGRVQVLAGFGSAISPAQFAVQQALAEAFVRTNPDIGVDFIRATGPVEAADRLKALLELKSPPDLVLPIGMAGIAELVEQKVWLDLAPLLKSSKASTDGFLPVTEQASRVTAYYGEQSKVVVGLPIGVHDRVLAYNVDLFGKAKVSPPPTLWSDDKAGALDDEFLNAAKALTNDRAGQFGIGKLSPEVSLFGFGGELYDTTTRRVLLDSPGAAAGAQFAADLIGKHRVQPPLASAEATATAWRSGKVAMIELCSCELGGPLGTGVPFTWKAIALPPGPARRFSPLDVEVGAIVAASKHPDLAWKLLEYLAMDPAHQRRFAVEAFSAIPALTVNRQAFADAVTRERPEVDGRVWIEGVAASSTANVSWIPGFAAVHERLSRGLTEVRDGAAASQVMPQVQKDAQAAVDAWFKKNKLPS